MEAAGQLAAMTALAFLGLNGGVCLVLAFLIGKPWVVLIPDLWIVVAFGTYVGWWGHGLGEGWQAGTATVIGVGIAGAVVGLAARWTLDAAFGRKRANWSGLRRGHRGEVNGQGDRG